MQKALDSQDSVRIGGELDFHRFTENQRKGLRHSENQGKALDPSENLRMAQGLNENQGIYLGQSESLCHALGYKEKWAKFQDLVTRGRS